MKTINILIAISIIVLLSSISAIPIYQNSSNDVESIDNETWDEVLIGENFILYLNIETIYLE